MRLSLTTCQPLFEELLLVLQPLSLLTFNLDLLFQHHHLEPDSHSPEIPSPPCQDARFQLSTKGSQSKSTGSRYIESLSEVDFGSPEHQAARDTFSPQAPNPKNGGSPVSAAPVKAPASLIHTSPQLQWVQEKEIGALPPDVDEDSLTQQAGQVTSPEFHVCDQSPVWESCRADVLFVKPQVIQQGWGAVIRWGGRLQQNLTELSQKREEVKTDLPDLQTQAGSDYTPVSSGSQVPWSLGRLFGASKGPSSPTGHTPPTRSASECVAIKCVMN